VGPTYLCTPHACEALSSGLRLQGFPLPWISSISHSTTESPRPRDGESQSPPSPPPLRTWPRRAAREAANLTEPRVPAQDALRASHTPLDPDLFAGLLRFSAATPAISGDGGPVAEFRSVPDLPLFPASIVVDFNLRGSIRSYLISRAASDWRLAA
jgi:hypothetical protein